MINAGNALSAYKVTVNSREETYDDMEKLSTRVLGALKACGAKPAIIKDADGIKKKIEGKRIGKKPEDPEKIHSTSQQSYDQLMAFFLQLISLVAAEPLYAPNEADLTVAGLITFAATLQPANRAVDDALAELNRMRDLRNVELYAPVTGLFYLSKAIKEYVKSVLGPQDPIYKRIAKIRFRNLY